MKLKRINIENYNPEIHALPIAAQDIDNGKIVSFDDETENGIPLVWVSKHTKERPAQGIAKRAKGGDPVIVFAGGAFCFGFQVGDIWVVE